MPNAYFSKRFMYKYLSLLCVLMLVPVLQAAIVTAASVERKGKVFYVDSTLEIAAERDHMFALLTDYDRMKIFSSGFVSTKMYPENTEGDVKVFMHLKGCVSFFCRHVKKMEVLKIEGKERITTVLIPEESDNVKALNSSWELSDISIPVVDKKALALNAQLTVDQKKKVSYVQGTKIRYQMAFHPDFWVPPVIGSYLVKKALIADGTQILNRMERYAQTHMGEPLKHFNQSETSSRSNQAVSQEVLTQQDQPN